MFIVIRLNRLTYTKMRIQIKKIYISDKVDNPTRTTLV